MTILRQWIKYIVITSYLIPYLNQTRTKTRADIIPKYEWKFIKNKTEVTNKNKTFRLT